MPTDTEDSTSEDTRGKRKQFSPTSPEFAHKSRKTARTPTRTKEKIGNEEKYDKIIKMMEQLMTDTRDIKQEQLNYKKEMQELRSENKELKEKLANLERKMENLEKKEKRNSVIIKGTQINEIDTKSAVKEFIKDNLGKNVEIESAYVVKPFNKETFVVAKFKQWEDKVEVMKNKNKFKGSRIFIDSDLTQKESRVQKIIRDTANAERTKGNQVRVYYNKLVINGETWLWNDKLEKLTKELKSQQELTKN